MGKMNDTQLKCLVRTAKILVLYEEDSAASHILQIVINSLTPEKTEVEHSTNRISASGVWPQNVIADVNHVREEYSITPSLTVGTEVRSLLDEKIPVTDVKYSDFLLDNKIVTGIVVDTIMDQNQAILYDNKKSVIIENIIVRREQ